MSALVASCIQFGCRGCAERTSAKKHTVAKQQTVDKARIKQPMQALLQITRELRRRARAGLGATNLVQLGKSQIAKARQAGERVPELQRGLDRLEQTLGATQLARVRTSDYNELIAACDACHAAKNKGIGAARRLTLIPLSVR
ncbi:MAG: hypothetical protein H6707_19975 [Deltaproteobacteria bacterium]|nr:hypothetical protein [Deltaproteobacteria bacterium]